MQNSGKFILFVLLLTLGILPLKAQNIASGEYFFDTDPGIGNGTALPSFSPSDSIDLNLNVNVSGLSVGFHQLYIRFWANNGQWGMHEGRTFYVSSTNVVSNLTEAEYFFDTDPGLGNGTPLPSFSPSDSIDLNLNVNVSGLSVGFHQLFVRFSGNNGQWGIHEGRTFYITSTNVVSNLTEAEYFFDTDPGFGNGTPLPSFSPNDSIDLNLNLNVAGLSEGFHQLYIRFRGNNGQWGIHEGRTFYVNQLTIDTNLTAAEYFFDTDPGFGNGTALPAFAPNDSVNLNFNASVAGLNTGQHYLFTRFKDSGGNWGQSEGKPFTIFDCTNSIDSNYTDTIVCDSFFWEADSQTYITSGIYIDTLINSAGCDSIVTLDLTINISARDTFMVTVCDSFLWRGQYIYTSGYYSDTLTSITTCDSISTINLQINKVNTGITVMGDSLISNNPSASSYQWFVCNVNNVFTMIPGATNRGFKPDTTGNYAVEVIEGSCTDTSLCQNVIIVGLSEIISFSDKLALFPNPNKGNFTVLSSQDYLGAMLSIYSMSGQLIKEVVLTDTTSNFNLSVSEGIYLVKVKDEFFKLIISN